MQASPIDVNDSIVTPLCDQLNDNNIREPITGIILGESIILRE